MERDLTIIDKIGSLIPGYRGYVEREGRRNCDKQLRSNLSSWNPVLRKLKFREEMLSITQKELNVLIIKKASWLNIDLVASSTTTKTNAFPISGFDIDNRNLLNELEFENIIENIVYENDLVIFEQKNTLELISEISKLIEIELNK